MNLRRYISDYFCTCALCGDRGSAGLDLCQPCLKDLPPNQHCCSRCALPLTSTDSHALCGRCLKTEPHFDSLLAPFRYEAPCDYMVTRLKFAEKQYFGRVIGQLLATEVETNITVVPDVIMPVPLHISRLRERGFNQSEQIANRVADCLKIKLDTHLLTRNRHTSAQTGLPAKQRKQNVRGAFSVRDSLKNKRVALVDDVVTTGSNANEIARVLHQAGADNVQVWAFARAAMYGISAT